MSPPTRYKADKVSPAPLGQPLHFEFSGKTAKNRFLKAAMSEQQASWDPEHIEARGIPSKSLINLYRRWGEGQYGLILSGNVMIEYDQLEGSGNTIVPRGGEISGERFVAFKELATAAKKHGSLFVAQVSHPGRQTSETLQQHPISASDVHLEGVHVGQTYAKPHAATHAEIQDVIEGFAHAAEFLHKAGFDGIQLHAAHGYLLAQFLATTTNHRTDQYGGSLENRSRILFEIASAVQSRVPKDFIVGIKINSVEFQKGGFDTEECKQLCAKLEEAEFDFVELSGGTYESLAFDHKRESTKKREAFFLEFAETIVPALHKTKTYLTGGFRTVGAMVKALDSIQGIGLARPVAQEPRLAADILSGKVSGGIEWLLDESNFPLTNVAAGSQLRMIGLDQEPIDLSNEKNKEFFEKQVGKWMEDKKNDKALNMSGYVPLVGNGEVPYGTAY